MRSSPIRLYQRSDRDKKRELQMERVMFSCSKICGVLCAVQLRLPLVSLYRASKRRKPVWDWNQFLPSTYVRAAIQHRLINHPSLYCQASLSRVLSVLSLCWPSVLCGGGQWRLFITGLCKLKASRRQNLPGGGVSHWARAQPQTQVV